jgi:hypothetical protein
MTPTEAAAELGVTLSQRLLPDLSAAAPKRLVQKAEAEARGWSWYFDGGSACRYGHVAARRTANPNICSDCERTKDGKEPIYGKSRVQKFYTEPRRKSKDPSAPVVIAAPSAPPAQVEPSKKEQEFLAALDETRDFDAAAQRTNFSRSQIEARASVNEVFRKALTDLCERRGIAWTRAPDSIFTWSEEVEKNLVRRFVDTGLLETARNDCGIAASDFYSYLDRSPNFAAAIEAARPRARETLRDRAIQAADRGQDKLLKILEEDAPQSIATMSYAQLDAELHRLINRFDAMGLFPKAFIYKKTGETVEAADLVPAEEFNADLVSA